MTQGEPGPFGRPPIGEQFEGHPVGDEEEVAPGVIAHPFLCEVEHIEHDSHEECVEDPGQCGGRGGIPHPPGGGYVPHQEGKEGKPEYPSLFALGDASFQDEQGHQSNESRRGKTPMGPGCRHQASCQQGH